MTKKSSLVKGKLLFTALIILLYLFGRNIPLFGIDTTEYAAASFSTEDILMQSIGGDIYRQSLMALGISPYMIASICVQIFMAVRNSDITSKISPKKMNRITLLVTIVLAFFQAIANINELNFVYGGRWLILSKAVCVCQMIAGVMVIIFLSERNKRYGIGGQSAIIFVNIADGLVNTVLSGEPDEFIIPGIVSLFVLWVVIVLENTEFRMPVQRISIHNVHAEKNYLAIKMNPVGVMPVMFSAAAFMVPQVFCRILTMVFPGSYTFAKWDENMTLDSLIGVEAYIVMLYVITIAFAFIFISPGDITEQMQKTGDCLPYLQAGWSTKWYLRRKIFKISFFSATMMGICLGLPLYLEHEGYISTGFASLPSTVMMLTGIWCSLHQEIVATKHLDAYKPFI